MRACFWGKEDTVDIILKRDDVDLKLRNKKGKTAEDIARKRGYNKIVRKLQVYAEKMGNKTEAAKNVSNTEIEQQIAERVLKTQMDAVKQQQAELAKSERALADKQAELAKREEAIAKKEANLENAIKTKANEIIADEKAQLAQERKNLQDEIQAYDNLINIQKEIIAEEVALRESGFRAFYNKKAKLPENMGYVEQLTRVTSILLSNKDKLSNTSDNTPKNILKSLQNDKEQILSDGLEFLSRVLGTSGSKLSETDLSDAIESIKSEQDGHIDIEKAALFITTLSWGQKNFRSIINDVKAYKVKAKI